MILTQRLRLRPWTDADIDAFASHNADPRIMRYFPSTMSRAQTAATVKRWQKDFDRHGFTFLAAEIRDTGEFIGVIGPAWHRFESPFAPAIEIGWRLHPDHWGMGYATEGGMASAAFIFDRGWSEVVAITVPDNAPSRAVMDRIGMTRDPGDDFNHPMGGLPHVLYRIDSDAFRSKHTGSEPFKLER
jgi:ribosomal-protein-alanine N-acetyltransferase